jgi:hypothetical protein
MSIQRETLSFRPVSFFVLSVTWADIISSVDPETKRKYDEIMAAALQEKQLCDEAMAGVNKKLNDVAEEDKSFTARIVGIMAVFAIS